MNHTQLLTLAKEARASSYSPYSGFAVGAALLCRDGRVFLGCNIENASFSPTCCAERVAIFKAISEGAQNFEAIAVVGGKGDDSAPMCLPCGVCRQVLAEFCDPDFKVVLGTPDKPQVFAFKDILPYGFGKNDLE